MSLKSFRAFLETSEGRAVVDKEFLERFAKANIRVDTLGTLLRFSRERWPDANPSDYRKVGDDLHGRERMREIWRCYLLWTEASEPKSAMPKAVTG
jgi:hypothetical protein